MWVRKTRFMNLINNRFYRQIAVLMLMLLFGVGFLPYVMITLREKEVQNNQVRLEKEHLRSINTLEDGVERFALLMTGIRAFILTSDNFPSEDELKAFMELQIRDLRFDEDLYISFLDSTFVFQSAFNKDGIRETVLVGRNIAEFIGHEELNRLNAVMRDDQLHLFPPVNLVDGNVGIPLVFRIVKENQVLGCIAGVLDFHSLIEPFYSNNGTNEYVYHFNIGDTLDFDMERVHDGSKVYHNRIDTNYYKNFNIDKDLFLYSNLNLYGLSIHLGTAVKPDAYVFKGGGFYIAFLLIGWYSFLALFVSHSVSRLVVFNKMVKTLEESKAELKDQRQELEQTNDELRQAVSTKDRLFSIIGHDLRSPLHAMITIMSWAKYQRMTAEKMADFVSDMTGVLKQNLSLLENLLSWSMINTNSNKITKSQIAVNDLVRSSIEHLKAESQAKNIYLVVEVVERLHATVDRYMMGTVIRNLISNAIKFSEESGKVLIYCREVKGQLVLEVRDFGVGMDHETLQSLQRKDSDPVWRGAEGEVGTGLGLVVTKEFVAFHGGHLEIDSRPKEGAVFRVILPGGVVLNEGMVNGNE